MTQQIGPRELALRAQREAHYQQTHKSKRATAETLKSKIEAIPAKKPKKPPRRPAKGQSQRLSLGAAGAADAREP